MGPIGVFDSGYGGLTILRSLRQVLPDVDFLYVGDNARAPYGSRSFDLVYRFTIEAVQALFDRGCPLVILACNTASSKALRSIQQLDLPSMNPDLRVLGVIRPTVEAVGAITRSGAVGILGTPGTIASQSYNLEIAKLHPDIKVYTQACPMWCPLVENNEADGPGADYFIKKDIDALLAQNPNIDTVVLGCTHYPILLPKIKKYVPANIEIVVQGDIVAQSLTDYLRRHPEMDSRISRTGSCQYFTTEQPDKFDPLATTFVGTPIKAQHIEI